MTFRLDRKVDKATAVVRRCRKAAGLSNETAGRPAFSFKNREVFMSFPKHLLFSAIFPIAESASAAFPVFSAQYCWENSLSA